MTETRSETGSLPETAPRNPELIGARLGDLVVARNHKFDGGAHWVVPGSYLGADEVGHWVAQPEGSFVSRPKHAFHAESPAVLLVPFTDDWVATFYGPWHPGGVSLYVDIVTGIDWHPLNRGNGWEMTLVDMDLDVVVQRGKLYIDDEDEFAEHQLKSGYPDELILATESAAQNVFAAVEEKQLPFDGRESGWFEKARESGLIGQQFR